MNYAKLVEIYEQLNKTSKRLGKTYLIAEFLKKTDEKSLKEVCLLVQGRIFPVWDERKIGVANRLIVKVIATTTGTTPIKVETSWRKKGDLGLVAEDLFQHKKQNTLFSQTLSITKVFSNLQKLSTVEGTGSVDR